MKFPKQSVTNTNIEKMLPPSVIPTIPAKESVIQKNYSDEYHSYDNSTSDSSSSDED